MKYGPSACRLTWTRTTQHVRACWHALRTLLTQYTLKFSGLPGLLLFHAEPVARADGVTSCYIWLDPGLVV
jgi:hypothetical protein